MKNARGILGSIYDGKMITTAKAFYQPVLELLQRFYAEEGRGLFIPENPKESPFLIAGPYTYETKDWGSKPTIIVSRTAIRAGLRPGFKAREHVEFVNGMKIYHDQIGGGCLIRVIDVDRAEEIAEEIFDLIWMSRHEMEKIGIFQMSDLILAPLRKLNGGANEHLKVCEISFNMVMNKRWSVTPINTRTLVGVNTNEL